jgi:guanosine-3',5'-bis(diphosphate) 3'-pyrophosphohydrolase
VPETPGCVDRSELCRSAYRFASDAHGSEGGTDFSHPNAVAELLGREGFPDEAIAAALLHDVVEDTGHGLDEIGERFGPEVCRLVDAMTEDARIEPYEARKDEHRRRVLAESPTAAAIYAADKLARVRGLHADSEPTDPRRLAHYRATLELFRAERPDLPFLDELEAELPELEGMGGARAG